MITHRVEVDLACNVKCGDRLLVRDLGGPGSRRHVVATVREIRNCAGGGQYMFYLGRGQEAVGIRETVLRVLS